MKFKRVGVVFFVLGLIVSLFFLGNIQAQEFSADIVSKVSGTEMKGKIYSAKDKVRMEAGQQITITRMDKKLAIVLMPDQKMYMEMPIQGQIPTPMDVSSQDTADRILVGTEVLEGKTVEKYKITAKTDQGTVTTFSWILKDSQIPVKIAAADGTWETTYQNIKLGSQSESLFEVPDGYTKFSMDIPSLQEMGDTALPEKN